MKNPVSDDALFSMILEADEAAYLKGEDPKQRAWTVPQEVMKRLGFQSYVMADIGSPPELERAHKMVASLYRPSDIGMGGVHLGAFMFRDVFGQIKIPIIFGSIGINPYDMTDFNENQLKWMAARPADSAAFYDQFIDVFDFGYGLMEPGHDRPVSDNCKALMSLAGFQMQSAASALSTAYDYRGAVQSALIATELSLKGGLSGNGLREADLMKFGHDLLKASVALSAKEANFDAARVQSTLKNFPLYVANRYSAAQPTRRETGTIVMGAQYIAGEVMRQFSKRDFRSCFTPPMTRQYPPL